MTSSTPTEPSTEPSRWLIAAFPDEASARRATRDASASGTNPRSIRIGNSLDALASVEAEMREETETLVAGWTAPVMREGTRGFVFGTVLGAVIGLVVALPFAIIAFGSLEVGGRMLILGVVGLVFGSFVGWYLGGAFGVKRPSEQLAATNATMVALPDTEPARRALLEARPTRLDVFGTGGYLIGNLLTSDPGMSSTVDQIAQNVREESNPD